MVIFKFQPEHDQLQHIRSPRPVVFAGLLVYCLLAVCTYKIQFCSSYSKTWGGGCPSLTVKEIFCLHRIIWISHLFCPIYKLLILGELGGVMRSFLSGRDTREGGEPDNWGTLSWTSSKSTDADVEDSGDPRRTSCNTSRTTNHYRVVTKRYFKFI